MAENSKFALLIGVAKCASGFKPLRCPLNGVRAMQEVLVHPSIGGFDPEHVVRLDNPDVGQMQADIGHFFSRCGPRDLVLFYFTGHGVTDEHGDFYFTTRNTEKFPNGSLNPGTAVDASFVRKLMSNCPSRRQVAILDCCFSGAFPDGVLAMSDITIDIKRQLGGEGRVVLTATTSTQYALEQTGDDLSVYTRYLVEGLKTGAAVSDEEQVIRVGHLHDYIRDKLRTAAAAMSPQIYAARDGRDIVLAQVKPDNELQYRKRVQRYLQEDGEISFVGRRILDLQMNDWGILPERAAHIEAEVTQPFRQRKKNLKAFAEVFQAAMQVEFPFSPRTARELRDLQHLLNLRDEDIAHIHTQLRCNRPLVPFTPAQANAGVPLPFPVIALASERGVDYTHLRDLLAAGKWREADYETHLRMLEAVGRSQGDWMRAADLRTFPCQDLHTVDRLWLHYSNGHFGFSVQREQYVACGAELDGKYPGDAMWQALGDRLGWRTAGSWVNYSDLQFDPAVAPAGELPWVSTGGSWAWQVNVAVLCFAALTHRLQTCCP